MLVIKKAAVLGAGRMGTAVAAQFANAGIPTLLLDVVPTQLTEEEQKKGLDLNSPAVRNRLAATGIATAAKGRPAAFAHPSKVNLLTPGNFEDDLAKLADVDWVVEAVVERLDIKQQLLAKVAPHVGPRDHHVEQLFEPVDQRHGFGAARRGQAAVPRHALLLPAALHVPARADPGRGDRSGSGRRPARVRRAPPRQGRGHERGRLQLRGQPRGHLLDRLRHQPAGQVRPDHRGSRRGHRPGHRPLGHGHVRHFQPGRHRRSVLRRGQSLRDHSQ